MYPVRKGYSEARARIQDLIENGHPAEAMLTAVFTIEKTIRRSLLAAAICSGLSNKEARVVLERSNMDRLKKLWPIFHPESATLPNTFGPRWSEFRKALTMRNKVVHGTRVYNLADYQELATSLLEGLDNFVECLATDLGHNGWTRLPVRRKSALSWHPPRGSGSK